MTDQDPSTGNEWTRPGAGSPRVFLSFHRNEKEAAKIARILLEAAGIQVVCYDPDNLWRDGPFEMLKQIVTACHCIVYVGRRSIRSKFVRFEHTISVEFEIPVLHAATASRVQTLIPKIQGIALRQSKVLWPQHVSSSISRSLQELEIEDFSSSRIVDTSRTGFDIGLDRVTGHHLDKIGNAMREGHRLFVQTLIAMAIVSVVIGLVFPRLWPLSVVALALVDALTLWIRH